MNLKKSQIKELIKQEIEEYKKTLEEILPSISETIEVEEGKMDALRKIATKAGKKVTPALKKAWQKAKPHAKEVGKYAADKAIDVGKDYLRSKVDKKFGKKTEGGQGSGRPTKPGSTRDIDKRMSAAVADANARLDAAEKVKKKKKVKESEDTYEPDSRIGEGNWKDVKKAQDDIRKQQMVKKTLYTNMPGEDPYKKPSTNAFGRIGGISDDDEDPTDDNSTKKESKGRRCTVKEIKKWMKGLEENRYKKTYNSDARRVSWMVNNSLSEDYDTMPVSMQKKWPKAAYKRERFLAKEFVKHLMSKQMNEQKLRKVIRKLIKNRG